MKHSFTDNTLLQQSGFIASNLALHFHKKRWGDLECNIISAAKEFGYNDAEKFIQHILSLEGIITTLSTLIKKANGDVYEKPKEF